MEKAKNTWVESEVLKLRSLEGIRVAGVEFMPEKNRLNQEQFTFKITKDDALFVFWNGKHVRTFTGNKAASILEELAGAESDLDIQYSLARVTGNFKRGNERIGKHMQSVARK